MTVPFPKIFNGFTNIPIRTLSLEIAPEETAGAKRLITKVNQT